MISRCYNKSALFYSDYGGRGIKVCDRWLGENGFENYVADIGRQPSKTYTLDRKNNDGNYEPGNVRWASKQTQVINRKKQTNNTSGYRGVSYLKDRNKWRASICDMGGTVYLGSYDTPEEAALAYNVGAKKYHRDKANLNIIE